MSWTIFLHQWLNFEKFFSSLFRFQVTFQGMKLIFQLSKIRELCFFSQNFCQKFENSYLLVWIGTTRSTLLNLRLIYLRCEISIALFRCHFWKKMMFSNRKLVFFVNFGAIEWEIEMVCEVENFSCLEKNSILEINVNLIWQKVCILPKISLS